MILQVKLVVNRADPLLKVVVMLHHVLASELTEISLEVQEHVCVVLDISLKTMEQIVIVVMTVSLLFNKLVRLIRMLTSKVIA